MSGTSTVTSTVSDALPGLSARLRCDSIPTTTSISRLTAFSKPFASTVSSYFDGLTARNSKKPCEFVVVTRAAPVSMSRTLTWAEATTAPVLSLTVPEMLPFCAQAAAANPNIDTKANTFARSRLLFISTSEEVRGCGRLNRVPEKGPDVPIAECHSQDG